MSLKIRRDDATRAPSHRTMVNLSPSGSIRSPPLDYDDVDYRVHIPNMVQGLLVLLPRE